MSLSALASAASRRISRIEAFAAQGVTLAYPSRSWSGVREDDGAVVIAMREGENRSTPRQSTRPRARAAIATRAAAPCRGRAALRRRRASDRYDIDHPSRCRGSGPARRR